MVSKNNEKRLRAFKFFRLGKIVKFHERAGVMGAGVAGWRRAFIAILAYTFRPILSRDKVSLARRRLFQFWRNDPAEANTIQRSESMQNAHDCRLPPLRLGAKMEVVSPLPASAFHEKPEGRKVAMLPMRTRIEELNLPDRKAAPCGCCSASEGMQVRTPGEAGRELGGRVQDSRVQDSAC